MTKTKDMLTVCVNVEVSPPSLHSIVQMAKTHAGRDEKGVYRVDTADAVSKMISKFLREKDFDGYAIDKANYSD